tara:strand:+ start:2668 stop:3642 length:975 start_codon:yes stop_codon:yes gene_type:complete
MNSWLRLWNDMPNDPKWRTISRVSGHPITAVMSVYIHLIVSANIECDKGVTQCDAEDVASALDLDTECVLQIIDAMQGRVLDGNKVKGWDKRQPIREDNSTERTRAYRKRKKKENDIKQGINESRRDDVTEHCDASERNISACDDSVTQCDAPEAEAEAEAEYKKNTAKAVSKKAAAFENNNNLEINEPESKPFNPHTANMTDFLPENPPDLYGKVMKLVNNPNLAMTGFQTLKEWQQKGYNEADILAGIQKIRDRGGTAKAKSLRYFNSAIDEEHQIRVNGFVKEPVDEQRLAEMRKKYPDRDEAVYLAEQKKKQELEQHGKC